MKDIVFKDIEISNIKEIPSETTRPAYLGGPDFRGLCVNIPYNDKCDERLNQVVIDIQNSTCNLSFSEEELEVITDSEVLKKLLSELIIRFDTDPSFYTKKDYQVLVAVLSKTIPYLYNTSSSHQSELGNLDDVIKTIKEELGIIKSDIDNINVGVTSINVETPSKYIKASPNMASEGDVTIALDVTAVEASSNYSTPSKGLATDAYVDEKMSEVIQAISEIHVKDVIGDQTTYSFIENSGNDGVLTVKNALASITFEQDAIVTTPGLATDEFVKTYVEKQLYWSEF